ncbi:protein kinase [Streptomyces sp. NBC_00249]|uniref:protein kinase domain-containing protein n=1 Tax=Streptomyces sp. NBC_00249 TaxID=2975690 RepID=UPI002250C4D0|nr:protein kinase [Streptomyces sp. NBC_00249]MCX5194605.1 protein kinase [Streptomyces sp. NBC_00249]
MDNAPWNSSGDVVSGGFAVRVGDLLADRYRLDRRLGAGGMGEVWGGHDLALDRAVAVKVLLEAATDEELIARFRREATIGARLQHPGITVVHDVGQHDGRLFIVMELLSGEDLGAVLARERAGLAPAVAVELAAQTAEALAAAHERAVVHRDLKPANLFLLPGGRLKICDFGIAHSADATAGWTLTGRPFGTPPYMAPEQWRGERVDARCDLYALGCVLYALLSGQPPFGSAEPMYVLMTRHIEDAPLSLRVAGTPVDPELDRLVLALLAKDPDGRPESAAAVAKALRALAGGPPAPREVVEPQAGPVREPAGTTTAAATPTGGGIPAEVREFVRELLHEAEEDLREVPPDRPARVEVLAVAADAAARFDTGLARRLLADAEFAAWSGGEGDGARVARLLTTLARDTAPHSPARAVRLLTDARQALFTVFGTNRQGPLRAVAEELARVAPEQAAQLTGYHLAEGPAANRLRALIATAVSAARPEEAERQLAGIPDPAARAAATYDLVLALAPRDLETALRLSERIGSAGARLLVLCQVARDRAAAGDPAGGALALEQAEAELPEVLQERAAWLREEAAGQDPRGRLGQLEGERLRTRAAALLGRRPEGAGDEKADHALASLAAARDRVEQGARAALDPVRAAARAERARELPDAAARAQELARIARDCVATAGTPWLAEVAAGPGTPPPHGATVVTDRAARPRLPDRDGNRWRTAAYPDSLRSAGDAVVWRSGAEVGCVRADTGVTRWTAFADEGVSAAPLTGRAVVDCAADAGSVYVTVAPAEADGARLLAREPRDGRVRWWRDLPGRPRLHPAGELLLAAVPGRLAALRADSGEELWGHPVAQDPSWSLTVAADRLVVGDGEGRRGLRLRSGEQLWSWARTGSGFAVQGDPRIPAPGGPALDGALVHFLDSGTLRAVRGRSGEEVWGFEPGVPASRLLVEGGAVYVAAHRREQGADVVSALDARSGAVLWQRPVTRREGTVCALELLGIRGGVLYVRASRGGRRGLLGKSAQPFVAALDLATGKPRRQWEEPSLGAGDVLLAGDLLVLPRPGLRAVALP